MKPVDKRVEESEVRDAREWTKRQLKDHVERCGRSISDRDAERYVNDVCDRGDRKREAEEQRR